MCRRFALVLAFGLIGCDAATDGPHLGDPYGIQLRPSPPFVTGDVLTTVVRYSGGCEAHSFRLGYTAVGNGADVWLTHDANGDACEANVIEPLTVRLPEAVGDGAIRLYVSETETVEVQRGP